MDGTSGNKGDRFELVTAKGINFPALIIGTAGGMDVVAICVWPATTAVIAVAG